MPADQAGQGFHLPSSPPAAAGVRPVFLDKQRDVSHRRADQAATGSSL